MSHDLIVVGGGPAGMATGIFAAQSGLRAVVLERRSGDLDKACGEGLMPPGVMALERMGITLNEAEACPFSGIRFVDDELIAEGRFVTPGRGVRRTTLIRRLRGRAAELGVEVRQGVEVTQWHDKNNEVWVETQSERLRAPVLVAADGLHSPIRRTLGLTLPPQGPRRFGLRQHFARAPWSPFVEVHWTRDAEAYITPISPSQVGVAFLYSGDGRTFRELLEAFPTLAERLRSAPPTSEPRGAGPFHQRVPRRVRGRVALVGDAAGYLDALTGEGLTLGFHAAEALVEIIARHRPLEIYERAYRRCSRTYYRMTAAMLQIARRPALRRRFMATLARHPRWFDHLLALNTRPPRR